LYSNLNHPILHLKSEVGCFFLITFAMKLKPHIQKPWKVPRNLERLYSPRNVEAAINFFNRVCESNFYILDFRNQKLISGNLSSVLLCGYPIDLVEKEGADFFKRILSENEFEWFSQLNKEWYNIFYSYPELQRQNLEFTYDLLATTSSQQEIILRHKLVPYKLDKNGNMWLGLYHITSSEHLSILSKAKIVNIQTGESYDYIQGKFMLSDVKTLSCEEIMILRYSAKEIPLKQIADMLKVSVSSLKRKRQQIFDKLESKTIASAIYKATMMKII